MKRIPCILFLLLPLFTKAQTGDMRVYTVAGSLTATALGDGGPATAASLGNTEGIWMDGSQNLYISTLDGRVRKVTTATGIITTIAGTGTNGYSGDGGPATIAEIKQPYGLYADALGNVYFADYGNNRVRRVDALTGIISTIAGGGISLGDNGPATNAQLQYPDNLCVDSSGNIYIGEQGRIRKINTITNNITTIAGTGTVGLSGDGGPATNAQLYFPSGMIFDSHSNLYFADRGNSRIRKINTTTGIISTIIGTTVGYSGDGGPATNAQINNPISFAIDSLGNIVIGDNGNNVFRKVNASTGIITTIAGGGTNTAEGVLAFSTQMHPEFIYLDHSGNIYYSNWGAQVRKITNYDAALSYSNNLPIQRVVKNSNASIYPNPATNELILKISEGMYNSFEISNCIGQLIMKQSLSSIEKNIDLNSLINGMYYIKFIGCNQIETLRFIKQ